MRKYFDFLKDRASMPTIKQALARLVELRLVIQVKTISWIYFTQYPVRA